jgi:hypothetical protein
MLMPERFQLLVARLSYISDYWIFGYSLEPCCCITLFLVDILKIYCIYSGRFFEQ